MYTRIMGIMLGILLGVLTAGVARALAAQDRPPEISSVRVERPPTVDGDDRDDAWKKATPVEIVVKRAMDPERGKSARVWLRSVHTDTHVYFLAVWEDGDESVTHRTWVWNAGGKTYEDGGDREDMFSLAFEHAGEFDPNMLAGIESVWDVWHWKAARTNPQGYAMDKTHRYAKEKPAGRANEHTTAGGGKIWIARPEDSGDSVEKQIAAPAAMQGDRVARYSPATPSSSAADVKAKGRWASGRWTLELARPLTTGNADDTQFDTKRSYKMGVATFDKTGEMDKASGLLILSFAAGR